MVLFFHLHLIISHHLLALIIHHEMRQCNVLASTKPVRYGMSCRQHVSETLCTLLRNVQFEHEFCIDLQ